MSSGRRRRRARSRKSPRRPAPRSRWSPHKSILALGALAASLASIIALATTILGWWDGPTRPGRVGPFAILSLTRISYGTWTEMDSQSRGPDNSPPEYAKVPGRLITYKFRTSGFKVGTEFPLKITRQDLTHDTIAVYTSALVTDASADGCDCRGWIPVPRDPTARYWVVVELFAPGKTDGEPLRRAQTAIPN